MLNEISGILLAAGRGSRFGGDKLLYRMPNGILMGVASALNLLPACTRLVAVVRPNDAELASALGDANCDVIFCNESDKGMGHSLAAGVSASSEASAWIVALGDMPFIRSATHERVASQLRGGADLVTTQYKGQRGHPVGFGQKWFSQLVGMTGDEGARSILRAHSQNLVVCSVEDPGVIRDIDSPNDLNDIFGPA